MMGDMRLGAIEAKFADLIWNHEPVNSTELVKLAAQELEWKKSTTYTVLRRLCEKGIFRNQDGLVTSVLSKSEFSAVQSEQFVEETFAGSLPAFLAAFTTRKSLTAEEVAEIQQMIDNGTVKETVRNGKKYYVKA